MKKPLRFRAAALAGAAIATLLGSCAYDPYYGSGGYGDSQSSISYGTGQGYGYGSSGFSTSVFVSTGNSRWGYDPYCNSYYDYTRRSYYDPYLYGYYPVGYRPPIIVGVPHPHGWRPGRGYCPPPSRVTNVTLVNYRNRESAYRNTDHSWARNVRTDSRQMISVRPQGRNGETGRGYPSRGDQPYGRQNGDQYTDPRRGQEQGRPSPGWGSSRPEPTQRPGAFNRDGSYQRQAPYSNFNRGGSSRTEPSSRPSRFNTPVAVPPQAPSRDTVRERPSFDPSQQRSAPEPRSAPMQRQAPEPRSAPPQGIPQSSREARSAVEQGPIRQDRRLR
jgi:hypothetical protein